MKKSIFALSFCCLSLSFVFEIEAQTFQIDSAKSEVRLLLYREGVLSDLAHNHVIVGKEIEGSVILNLENPSQSSFQMKVPVDSLIVDAPEHRQQEGSDFQSVLSQEDREEIRETMLAEEILYAEKYAHVHIRSLAVSDALPHLTVTHQITIRDVAKSFTVPVRIEYQANTLIVQGKISLKQTDFGIQPVRLFLGAIQVQDTIHIKFHIVAFIN